MRKKFSKKKNPIKSRKQRLCDRINQCKSLKELKEWERVFSFHSVLKDDQDWDYDFLFDLIEFKLKRMSQYFHSHHIVENEDWYGTLCDRAVNILRAGYKTDIVLNSDLRNYVNTRNIHRFLNPAQVEFISRNGLEQYYFATIRETKAKALFWKFMHHYVEYLWD